MANKQQDFTEGNETATAEVTAEVAKVKVKPVLSPEERKAKKKKRLTLITYIIALLCLIGGFFAPLYGQLGNWDDLQGAMLIKYLPGAINTAFLAFLPNALIPVGGWFLEYKNGDVPYTVTIDAINIDIQAWLITLYAVVTVLAIILLFPVIFGKRTKKTSIRCALIAETLALVVLGVYVVMQCINFKGSKWIELGKGDSWYNLVFAAVFGAVFLMTIIQSIATKGSTGTAKLVLFILSALSFICLLDITAFIPAIKDGLTSFSSSISSTPSFTGNLADLGTSGIHGLTIVDAMINGSAWKANEPYKVAMQIVLIVIVAITIINLFVDMISVATGNKWAKDGTIKRNKFGKVTALIRYIISFAAATTYLVMLLILRLVYGDNGYSDVLIGLYLYMFGIIAVIQIIISIVRLLMMAKATKKAKEAEGLTFKDEELNGVSYSSSEIELVGDEAYGEVITEPVAEPVAEEQPEEEDIIPVTPVVYAEEEKEPEPVKEEPVTEEQEEEVIPPPVVFAEAAEEEEEPAPEPEPEPEPVPEPVPATVVYKEAPVQEATSEPAASTTYSYGEYAEEPEQLTIPMAREEQPATQERTIVYNYRTIYNGPTDKFMETLTDEEKVEFVQTFIEKRKGEKTALPTYQIGGDNEDFFPSIFIHINRYRNLISPALLSKISYQII